jgi:hypothetical protein
MKKNGNTLTTLTIIIGIFGIISPILWDWYNSSYGLTLTHIQTTKLIEKKSSIIELEVFYKKIKINNLTKTVFKLENTGRNSITKNDIVDDITIIFPNSKILNASIDSTIPNNMNTSILMDKDSVKLSFQLLNSKDIIQFSILTDSVKTNFISNARIKNIKELELLTPENQIIIKQDISWVGYIIIFFTALFSLTTIIGIFEIPKVKKELKKYKEKETIIYKNFSLMSALKYIDDNLSFLTESKKNKLKDMINDNSSQEKILQEIETEIKNNNEVEGTIFSIVLAIAGIWYILRYIIS